MNLKLLNRRVAMYDMVLKGFHPASVISQVAKEYQVTQRCLWSDWERRSEWIPILLSLEKYAEFTETLESKLNAVQKAAWRLYVNAGNDNARVGALKIVLDSLELQSNTLVTKDILQRLEHVEELTDKNTKE